MAREAENGKLSRQPSSTNRNGQLVTVATIAMAKRLPVKFLEHLGVHNLPTGGIGMSYYGLIGEDLFVRERESPRCKDNRFWQPAGVRLQPYGQWRLDEARKGGVLVLVEGESDCWTLWHHGMPVLGIPGSSSGKCLATEHVEDIAGVYVVREPDKGGDAFVKGCVSRLKALHFSGRIFELRMPDGIKDPADQHADDPERFVERLKNAMMCAPCILGDRRIETNTSKPMSSCANF